MANPMTEKEQNFLTELDKILNAGAQTEEQKKFAQAVHDRVAAKLGLDGESSIKDVFAAMQEAVDEVKGQIDRLVEENRIEATRWYEENKNNRSNGFLELKQKGKIDALGTALSSILSQENIDHIAESAQKAELSFVANESLTINSSFSKDIIDIYNRKYHPDLSKHQKTEPLFTTGRRTVKAADKVQSQLVNQLPKLHTFVVRGDLKDDSIREYDTLGEIADAWIRANKGQQVTLPALNPVPNINDGKAFPETTITVAPGKTQHDLITTWLAQANQLKIGHGKDICTGRKFNFYAIYPGLELALPGGDNAKIGPRQTMEKTNCPIEFKDDGINITNGKVLTTVLKDKPTPIIPTPDAFTPHEYVTQALYSGNRVKSADGKTRWQVESPLYMCEMLAKTNFDPEFTKNWYSIHNIAARKSIRGENMSGQVYKHDLEGDYPDKNKITVLDDKTSAKHDDLTGGTNDISRALTGSKGQPFVGGFTRFDKEKTLPNGEPNPYYGSLIRHDGTKEIPFWLTNGNNGFTIKTPFGKIVVPTGPVGGGIMISNPATQQSMVAVTERGGLTQVNAALSDLNFAGYSTIFSNEQAMKSEAMATQGIGRYLFKLNAKKVMEESWPLVETTTGQAQKDAAKKVFTAFNEYYTNPDVNRIDAADLPLQKGRQAIAEYFERRGMKKEDLAVIQQEALKEHLVITDMSAADKKKLPGYGKDDEKETGARYGGITPGGNSEFYELLRKQVYRPMNSVEATIAKGEIPVLEEKEAIVKARSTLGLIRDNDVALASMIGMIKNGNGDPYDHNGQVAIAAGLHDMIRNPKNYFPKGKGAEDFVKKFFNSGDAKKDAEALDEVTRQGNSTALPFIKDNPFPLSRPELVGEVVGKTLEQHPELLKDYIDRVSDAKYDKDGRRFAVALATAVARQRAPYGAAMGSESTVHAAVTGAFKDEAEKKQVTEDIDALTVYSESSARHVDMQGLQWLDNAKAKLQRRVEAGEKVTQNQAYFEIFQSGDAVDSHANQVAVQGLRAEPALARDAMLLSLLSNPAAFKGIKQKLKDYGSVGLHARQFKQLGNAIEDVIEAATKAGPNGGSDEQLLKSVQTFGDIYVDIAAKATKNKGLKRENAVDGMLDIIGNNQTMSKAVIDAISKDAGLQADMLKAVVPTVSYASNLGFALRGKSLKTDRVADTDKDGVHESVFFSLPRDEKGNIDYGPFWNRNEVTMSAAQKQALRNALSTSVNDQAKVDAEKEALAAEAKAQAEAKEALAKTQQAAKEAVEAAKKPVIGLGSKDDVAIKTNETNGLLTSESPIANGTLLAPKTPGILTADQKAKLSMLSPKAQADIEAYIKDNAPTGIKATLGVEDKILLSKEEAKDSKSRAHALTALLVSRNPKLAAEQGEIEASLTQLVEEKDDQGKPLLGFTETTQGLIQVTPNSKALALALSTASILGTSRGINGNWLLLPLLFIHHTPPVTPYNPVIGDDVIPGCPECVHIGERIVKPTVGR